MEAEGITESTPAALPMLAAPTASGKSELALRLARHFPIEVVTADAMQVYRGMDVGTAKPTRLERAQVPHHLLDLVTPGEAFSVAQWVEAAEAVIADVLARGNLPLVVGGTGFYLQALREGLPTVPPASEEAQAPIWRELERAGLEPLQEELERSSPEDARRTGRNPRRVVRAIEILRRTGKAPSEFPFSTPRFTYSLAVLEPPLHRLQARIEERCRQMFEAGLANEVEDLLRRFPEPLTAMQAIGYKEVGRALEGESSMEQAREAVASATLRYAKRQLTWFRKQDAQLRVPLLAHEAFPQISAWLAQLQYARRADR